MQLELTQGGTYDTNLIGDIKYSSITPPASPKTAQNVLIEIESVMMKYKVVSLNLCLDGYKMVAKSKQDGNL